MRTIHKYSAPLGSHKFDAPKGAVPLHFAFQHRLLYLWMLVETDQPLVAYQTNVVGTGSHIGDLTVGQYVGTTIEDPGSYSFVWHCFLDTQP